MEMEQPARLGVAERRARLTAAVEALEGLAAVLPLAGGSELPELMGQLDRLAVLAGAGRVAVTAEAAGRGEVSASQSAGVHGWVRDHAPSLRQGGSAAVVRCVEAFARPDNAAVREAVLDGRVSPAVGWTVVRNMDRLRDRLVEEAVPTVTEAMLAVGEDWGASMVGRLRSRLLAEYGEDGELEEETQRARRFASLSHGVVDDDGLVTYRLVADAELSAVLEAAIAPHAAPVLMPDGSRDPRLPDRRRAEALAVVCRRSVAAAESLPVQAKATVVVTMTLGDLQERSGCGTTVGSPGPEHVLSPETVRRMACDGQVVPVLLGSKGEVLDLGRLVRCFTPGQLRLLRLRDRHCTFPGCTMPGSWCDGHHVRHWADDGPSDPGNGALLCPRHHDVVHRDRLLAIVTARGGGEHGLVTPAVTWDLAPGSYDRALERWRAEEADERARRGAPPGGGEARSWTGPRPVLRDGVLEMPIDAVPWDDPDWEPEDPGANAESWEDASADAWEHPACWPDSPDPLSA
ncbi:MAG TPA: DUF222 domain-containing protein [Dermatophilaceae bacterium]|nr:DUF222 domain-containing protein [Dermatophilaceae bacterium]